MRLALGEYHTASGRITARANGQRVHREERLRLVAQLEDRRAQRPLIGPSSQRLWPSGPAFDISHLSAKDRDRRAFPPSVNVDPRLVQL